MAKRVTGSLCTLLVFGCCLLCVFSTRHGMIRCPPGQYWDHGTNKCDQCAAICLYAEQQGTLDACKKKCPGYNENVELIKCANGTYYDKHVNKCELCGPLCFQAKIQGTVHECNANCPGFLQHEHEAPRDDREPSAPLNSPQNQLLVKVAIGILSIVVVIALAGTVLLIRRTCVNNEKTPPDADTNELKYSIQVEDQTTQPGCEVLQSLV